MDLHKFLLWSAMCCSLATVLGSDSLSDNLARANNQFAVDLHKALGSEKGNIFFSPFSISMALAMLMYGARGDTQNEMYRMLSYDEADLSVNEVHTAFRNIISKINAVDSKEYILKVANALLAQKGHPIENKYKEDLQNIYRATVKEVDFQNGNQIANEINEWVSKATNKNIPKLLESVDPSNIMFILNAVYFKGAWDTTFDPDLTANKNFYNGGMEPKAVPMMHMTADLPYKKIGGLQILELPCVGHGVSMIILLPDAPNGISELEKHLEQNLISHIRKQMTKESIKVVLPKFKLEYEKKLSSVLKKLGFNEMFKETANFRGISAVGGLSVSEVTHKAVIEVNEEGSEASAGTGVDIGFKMLGDDVVFNADHPFIFAIVEDETSMILFQGRVSQL